MEMRTVTPEAVIALAILQANMINRELEIEDISKLFVELEDKGIRMPGVSLRRVPSGYYSEDVEAFVGRYLAAGLATARSPIAFSSAAITLCKQILREEHEDAPEALGRVAKLLNMSDLVVSAARAEAR